MAKVQRRGLRKGLRCFAILEDQVGKRAGSSARKAWNARAIGQTETQTGAGRNVERYALDHGKRRSQGAALFCYFGGKDKGEEIPFFQRRTEDDTRTLCRKKQDKAASVRKALFKQQKRRGPRKGLRCFIVLASSKFRRKTRFWKFLGNGGKSANQSRILLERAV